MAKDDGDYGAKRVILESYDDRSESIRAEQLYQTPLDPAPAGPRRCDRAQTRSHT